MPVHIQAPRVEYEQALNTRVYMIIRKGKHVALTALKALILLTCDEDRYQMKRSIGSENLIKAVLLRGHTQNRFLPRRSGLIDGGHVNQPKVDSAEFISAL